MDDFDQALYFLTHHVWECNGQDGPQRMTIFG